MIDNNYEPRLWLCNECGFVLGVVQQDNSQRPGSYLRYKLAILRNGCHISNIGQLGDLRNVATAARLIEGGDVSCGMCGAVRRWLMSDQALEDLITRRRKRTYGLEPV